MPDVNGTELTQANLTLGAAARRLGVSPHTLRVWAVYGRRLPYLRFGRVLRFRPADIEAFERQSLVAARIEARAQL